MAEAAGAVAFLDDTVSFGPKELNKIPYDTTQWVHEFSFPEPNVTILGANLNISFIDNEDDGGDLISNELAMILLDGPEWFGYWVIPDVDSNSYGYDINVTPFSSGSLGVTLIAMGDFWLTESVLHISYEDAPLAFIENYQAPAPIPEPATMLLFGTGLLSLATGFHHRKKHHKLTN
jgi:hypothetical protein